MFLGFKITIFSPTYIWWTLFVSCCKESKQIYFIGSVNR